MEGLGETLKLDCGNEAGGTGADGLDLVEDRSGAAGTGAPVLLMYERKFECLWSLCFVRREKAQI